MRKIAQSVIVCLGLVLFQSAGAWAGTVYTYWPGFVGKVGSVLWPADAGHAADRYLTLVIEMSRDPRAGPKAFDAAFHAACQRHRPELLRLARRVSPDNDWRVRVRFSWPVSSAGGVTVVERSDRAMWLSTCRDARE